MLRTLPARGNRALALAALSTLAAIAAAFHADPAAAQAGRAPLNLLRNPSVEEGVLFTPTGWETTAVGLPTIRFDWDATTARTGERSLYLYNTSDAVPIWHNWHQYLTEVSGLVGKDVIFRGWAKTRQLRGLGYLLVQAYSDTITVESVRTGVDRVTMRERMGIKPADDPQSERGWARAYFETELEDWTRFEVRLFIPPTTNLLIVRAGIFGVGEIWFDDLELVAEPPAKEAPLPAGKNLLMNAGFEEGLSGWDFSLAPMDGLRVHLVPDGHSGANSASIESQGRPPVEIQSSIFQVFNTRQLSGKKVRFQGWVRVEELVNSQAYLRLWANGTYGDYRPPPSKGLSGTSEWTLLTVEAKIPEGTTQLWAQAAFATHYGTVYVDDLSLEIIE